MEFASFCTDALECFCCPLLQEIDFLVQYTKNISKFRDQAQTLNAVVADVNYSVEQATGNGEAIENEVQDWLQRANNKATEAQNLENEVRANQRCACACCSPDWLSRYNLSKKAVSIAREMGVICAEKNFESASLPAIPEPTAPAPASHFMSFQSTQNAMEEMLEMMLNALKDDNNNINIVSLFPANKSDTDASSEYNQKPPVIFPSKSAKMKSGTGRNGINPDFPEQLSIASLFPPNKSDTDASSEYNQIPPNFSHHNSPFPANKSDTDVSSEQNQIPPNFSHHNSNSIVSVFPPARSQTDEIIIPNPTITSTSFSHVFPSSNGPTTIQISIPSLFPPTVSETEIDGSASSKTNETHPRIFDSIASFFPPFGSPSHGSENYETTQDHSIASIFPAEAAFNSYVFQQFLRSLSLQNYRPQGAMEDALKALKDNNNINIVGVYGMGGVGKTTMVKQIAQMVITEGLFHRVVWATVSQTLNIEKIQHSIAVDLDLWLKNRSEEGRANELREKIMADKRILVILDDVWEWIDLASIGIPIGSDLEACKSKILLTTRREHVCHLMGCKENRILLNLLSPEDSWDLFIKTAGTVFDSAEFEAVAREVVEECQGLPVALVIVARVLGDKDEEEWKKAARLLKRFISPHPDHQEKVAESLS